MNLNENCLLEVFRSTRVNNKITGMHSSHCSYVIISLRHYCQFRINFRPCVHRRLGALRHMRVFSENGSRLRKLKAKSIISKIC